jgi:hypothetical protein
MANLNLNPELENGDRVICISMDDMYSPVHMGTPGTVMTKSVVFGDTQYYVAWDNGSKLALIAGVDKWVREEDMKGRRKKTEESVMETTKKGFLKENFFQQNKELFKYFNHAFLHKYLKSLRESGVVNMLGAAPYFVLGSKRVAHEHHYDDNKNEEAFEEVVEMADQARDEMIRGAMKLLEAEGKEITPESVKKIMDIYSRKMVMAYTKFAGGYLNTN